MNHNINLKKLKSNIPQNSQLTERIQLFSQYVERQFTLKKFKISDDIRNRYDIFDYKKLTSNKNVDINYLCKDSLDEFKIFLKADQVFEEQKNKINFEIKNC